MQELKVSENQQTMSSREIAALTGKEHHHVKRDIQAMAKELEIDVSKFGYIYLDESNRQQREYRLDRYHTEVLITGYDIKRRAAVIRRWYDLETGKANPQHLLQRFEDYTAGVSRLLTELVDRVENLESKRLEDQVTPENSVPYRPRFGSKRAEIYSLLGGLKVDEGKMVRPAELENPTNEQTFRVYVTDLSRALGIRVSVHQTYELGAFLVTRLL